MLSARSKHIINSFPFLLGVTLVICFFLLPILGSDLSYFPGHMGDGRLVTYILEHAYNFFIGKEPSLWNAPFMHPEPNIITYSENLVGSAPFYSVFRLLGADRETSFQLWFVVMYLLNYACAYFFLNWQFKNKYAAVLGGLVFACSMAIQSQMTHAQTFPRYAIPLAFWMAMLFMKNLKPAYFFGAVFMVVYQFYCSLYLGFFLVIPITLFLLFTLINKRELFTELVKNMKWLSFMIVSMVANVLIILPLILPYIERSKTVEANLYENIISTVPTLRSFFYSQDGSLLWSGLSEVGLKYPDSWDHQIFSGGIATLSLFVFSVFIGLCIFKKKMVKKAKITPETIVLFLTMGLTFLLFIRYQGYSFYRILYALPGFDSLGSMTRIINIELLFFAFATAFIANVIFNRYKKIALPLFLLFSVLFVVDNYFKEGKSYRTKKELSQEQVNSLIEKMKKIPEGSIVSYEPEFDGSPTSYQIDAMLAGQSLGLKMINGYTSTSPHGYSSYWREMSSDAREKWLKINGLKSNDVFIIH